MKRVYGIIGAVLVLCVVSVSAQTFPAPITQAIALLTSGITPFSIVGINTSGYVNWGTGRSATGYGLRDNAGVIESKDSGGSWSPLSSSGGAPSTATYITQTPNSSLSAEQAMSTLATALVRNTTTTGVQVAYTGTSCTNQFISALSAVGAATCASVSPATFSGILTVPNGGTGVATLTGIPLASGTTAFAAITSSTVGQVLRVTGANAFAFGAVDLDDTDAVTGTLGVANGGTNLNSGTSGGIVGFTASGTIASSVALTANAIVLGGGAGATPTPLGSLGTTITVLHGNAAGSPTFGPVDLATETTGSIGPAQGGTGQASYTIGDLLYASGTTTLAKLAAVSANSFLRSTGAGAAPAWSTTKWPNSGVTGDLLYVSATNQYANLTSVAAGSFLRSGGVTTAPVWSTLTLPNTVVTGDMLFASATNTVTALTAVATGRILSSGGVATAPVWRTDPSSTSFTVSNYLQATEILYAALPGTPVAGQMANISDGNSAVWGATVAGGGTDRVQVRYNGANWTVVGK